MNPFKRAMTSVKRRPVKSITFFVLIFLLSALTAGAITAQQAIHNTDANLRRRMPTITMIEPEVVVDPETGEWPLEELPILTPELIREVANLPYVAFFDYAIDVGHWSVTSSDLEAWTGEEIGVFWPTWNYSIGLGAYLRPRGVSSPEFIEARQGLIELVDGRTFTEEELVNRTEVTPVIISSELARLNGLEVGSTFDSRLTVWDRGDEESMHDGTQTYEERGFTATVDETFPMEVIGIFEAEVPEIPTDNPDLGFPILNQVAAIHHRVYLPNHVAEEMFDLRIEGEMAAGIMDEAFDANVLHFFTLADPMYYNDFVQAVSQLEGNWEVLDLSSGFQEVSASMENMQGIAHFILMGSIGATVVVVSLLVLLFLRDRKHEIGVYLAMGDGKKNIVMQMVLELVPLAVLGLTLALLVGNVASTAMSREMLSQDLAANPPTSESVQMGGSLENLGYRFTTTHEEMFESFEISLDGRTVVMFYGIGLGTVLVSTFIPIAFVVHTDPKKLLMED